MLRKTFDTGGGATVDAPRFHHTFAEIGWVNILGSQPKKPIAITLTVQAGMVDRCEVCVPLHQGFELNNVLRSSGATFTHQVNNDSDRYYTLVDLSLKSTLTAVNYLLTKLGSAYGLTSPTYSIRFGSIGDPAGLRLAHITDHSPLHHNELTLGVLGDVLGKRWAH